jgi:DNA repair exonuclease SbcCD ATPase subunit
MNNAFEFRQKLEKQKGQRDQIVKTIAEVNQEIEDQERSLRRHESAREIIRTVGQKTQEQLQYHISDITTLAMEAVFKKSAIHDKAGKEISPKIDAYQIAIEFVPRRNKTECDILFIRDGQKIDPISASGGGTVDMASFALRVAMWSMSRPHSRNVIILDEPLRFLSADNQEKASAMIKELSQKLGLQFIIVTHEQVLTKYADRIFEVKIRKGISKVTQS